MNKIEIKMNKIEQLDRSETFGKFQLTTKQVLKEIIKTDKVIANFEKALQTLRDHKDKSNSTKYKQILENLKDYIEEVDREASEKAEDGY